MQSERIYPYIRIFTDDKDNLHYVTYTTRKKTAYKQENAVGSGLIDFILLDLKPYSDEIEKYFKNEKPKFCIVNEAEYAALRNTVFDIAELLKNRHDYLYFFLVGQLNAIFEHENNAEKQIATCFSALEDVIRLQSIFINGIHWCFDADNLQKYSQSERFIGFLAQYPQYNTFAFKTGIAVMPTYKDKLDIATVNQINKANITNTREQLKAIHKWHGKGVSLLNYTLIESLNEILYFEFTEMLKQGTQLKICKHCGKYFALKNGHNTDYCSRPYNDGKQTCKQIANKNNYLLKISADPFLLQYERIYNAKYAKMLRDDNKEKDVDAPIAKKQFIEWSATAQELRKQYVKKEISGDELIKILS